MQFNLNLATRSYVNLRQLNLAIFILTALLLLWLAFTIKTVASNFGEAQRIEQQIAAMDSKLKGEAKGVPPKEYEVLLAKIAFANSIIEKKNLDWLKFLNQLETVVPEGIALTAVDPDPEKKTLKVTGVAKNFVNLRTFFETLESSTYFRNVYLENQSEIKVGQNQKGVNFTITCMVIYQ